MDNFDRDGVQFIFVNWQSKYADLYKTLYQ